MFTEVKNFLESDLLSEEESKFLSLLVSAGLDGLNSVDAAEFLGLKDQIRSNWIISRIGRKYLSYIGRKRPKDLAPYEVISNPEFNHRDLRGAYKWVARHEFSMAWNRFAGKHSPMQRATREFIEGTKRMRNHIAYERNSKARAICLAQKGYTCEVCGFNFEEKYGEAGKEFAEVHHQRMVSEGKRIYTDPAKELLVVCSNCHSIIHRREPPYTKEEMVTEIKRELPGRS